MANKYIEAATEYYKSLGTRSMEIPNWKIDGKPVTIYWKPMTVIEHTKFVGAGIAQTIDRFVEVIIGKALNENGEKIFNVEDKQALLRSVEYPDIIKLGSSMILWTGGEEAEKN